jgi:ABC-type sugar transport system substrate-binding protein
LRQGSHINAAILKGLDERQSEQDNKSKQISLELIRPGPEGSLKVDLENAAADVNDELRLLSNRDDITAVVVRPVILNPGFEDAVEALLQADIFVVILETIPGALSFPAGVPRQPVFISSDYEQSARKLAEFTSARIEKHPGYRVLVLGGPPSDPIARLRSSRFVWEVWGVSKSASLKMEIIDSWATAGKSDQVKNALSQWKKEEKLAGAADQKWDVIVYGASDRIVEHLATSSLEDFSRANGFSIEFLGMDGTMLLDKANKEPPDKCLATIDVSPKKQGQTAFDILLSERRNKSVRQYTQFESKLVTFWGGK